MIFSLSKREKFIAFTTIILIVAVLIYVIIIEPLSKKWVHLNKEIASKSVKLKKDLRLLSKKNILEKEYKNYLNVIKTDLSEEEESTNLLSDLETIAKNDSVAIVNIKPSPTKNLAFYKELIFDISLESSMDEILKFIYDVQSSRKLLKVKRLSLSAKASEPGIIKCALQITKILIK